MIEVKVCGLTDAAAVAAAADAGACYLGFVFYPPSPRSLTPEQAAPLAAAAPAGRLKVGVVVDAGDAQLERLLSLVALDALQLHGAETPARVAAIKARTGRLVIKAVRIAAREDLAAVDDYAEIADLLLFDAKPSRAAGRLPGGNGEAFDWALLQGLNVGRPWLLSGGLFPDNLEIAVRQSGARAVDVSSGVEARPGHKDPAKIRRFLQVATSIGPS
jgi:phosphoribosylanthranilate isomerase